MDGVESGIRSDAASAQGAGPRDERGRRRVVIERVWPEIDAGRFPIKRTVGEQVTVSADVFADGHGLLAGVLKYRFVPAGRPSPGQRGSAEPAPRTRLMISPAAEYGSMRRAAIPSTSR